MSDQQSGQAGPPADGAPEQPGRESWRPARETRAQREWKPGQVKKARSIRATFTSSVLVLEALVLVLFGLALFGVHRGEPQAGWILGVSLVLAVVAILTCALVRKPVGIWIGWGLQVVLLLGVFLEYTMVIIGVGFGLAWWYAVTKGGQIDRENRRRAEAEARWRAEHPDAE
ncbi:MULTISPECIES: DUF4233 domain-containing protein [Citricoccus]|uniref:DUF4233 domain-containing protein n=1 Tax=Citricoccus TaxID=169133 RepID=UPI000255F04D|nr:DUF4233 domain-containing protein [Citricoccus sp. CH26A]